MNKTVIWATVVAIGKNRERAEQLQAELDTIRRERLRDGIKAIYVRDGIRAISAAEMRALVVNPGRAEGDTGGSSLRR